MVEQSPKPTVTAGLAAIGAVGAPVGMIGGYNLRNGIIVPSVAGNNLTVAIKTVAGDDPSATDPVFVAFREANGTYTTVAIEAPLSLALPPGFYLSWNDNEPFRLWLLGINDGGSVKPGVYRWTYLNGPVPFLDEINPITTLAAPPGAGGTGVVYSAAIITNGAYRVLGYMDWSSGLSTKNQWSVGPDATELYAAGHPKPGQFFPPRMGTGTFAQLQTGNNTIPFDNSIPLSSEGWQIGSWSMTPRSAVNYLLHEVMIHASHSTIAEVILALFRNNEGSARACAWADCARANGSCQVRLIYIEIAGVASQLTFKYRTGASQAGTLSIGGCAGTEKFITTDIDLLSVTEIMG